MASATYTQDPMLGTWLRWDVYQPYVMYEKTFLNNSGAAAAFKQGLVIEESGGNIIPQSATAANAAGVLATDVPTIADSATMQVKAMMHGPSIVNPNEMNFGASDLASVQPILEAKQIKFVPEPEKQTTGKVG